MDIAAKILLIWPLCLLSVLLHELGHALGYRLSGGKADWKVAAGSGPRMFGTKKYAFHLIPMGGWFVPAEEPATKKGIIAMFAGGPLVSLLQAVLYGLVRFLVFGNIQPESGIREILFYVTNFVLLYNLFQFLFTIIPVRYRIICRGHDSDGLQIIHALRHKKEPEEDA